MEQECRNILRETLRKLYRLRDDIDGLPEQAKSEQLKKFRAFLEESIRLMEPMLMDLHR